MLGKLLQGRYRIVQVLSTGGFCKTYLAEDTELTNHPTCVVKHLLRTSDEPESIETLRQLFTREAEALKKLGNYDRVPQLLAHFEENLEFYLVQEFILGHTLSVELQKSWSEGAVVQLLQEALSILEYVHSHGLIHRDIKPNNLIRRQQDNKLVLIDFGSVKQAWTQVVTSQGKTSTSYAVGIPATIAIGTPGYMPSEQARGRPRPASDIYGLGIIGIQALTGLNPTQLLEDSDTGEIIWEHHVRVSPALANVLTKMVRYHFQERYESATEALQALRPLINRYVPRQAAININPQGSRQEKVIGQSQTAILAPEKATKQVTLPDLKDKRPIPPLEERTSDGFFPSLPKKSPLVIGIATSFAAVLALTAGSYYFLRSPGSVPEVKTPVAIPSKNLVGEENPLKTTLTGHSEGVWAVALSSDGKTLVSGSADKTIKVWNLDTEKLIRTLSGHSDSVRSVALSSDRQILASGSGDNTIKLWNVQTGEQIKTISGHTGPVWSVAISPDGQTLVSGSEDTNIKIWDLPTGNLRSTLADHSSRVFSVAISPDGQTLATAGSDKSIRIWNLSTGKLRRTLKGHSDAVRSVAFGPDGQTLASGSWDKTVKVWNWRTGEVNRTFEGHSDRVVSVAFSNDSQMLASAGIDRTIKIWNLQTGKLRRNLTGHSDWVLSIATSPVGQTVVSGSKDQTIKIWQF